MRDKVERTIETFRLLERGDKVIVAVSGGPDSMALLKILLELAGVYDLTLLIAHLNHGLRGAESDRDERFVRECGEAMGLPFVSERVNVREAAEGGGKTIEEAGREARYDFLEAVRRREDFDKVALGHHLDDQAETVMMRFLRGSGPRGLKGMVPRRDAYYIRPLLGVTRKEILAYLGESGTTFVEDSSNEQDLCLRNRIRRRLIPQLVEAFNPRLVEKIGWTAEILRTEDAFMEGAVEDILKEWRADTEGGVTLSVTAMRGLHEALQRRAIKTVLLRTAGRDAGIGFRHVEAVRKLIQGNDPGASLHLPFHLSAERQYDLLRLRRSVERAGRGEERLVSRPSYCYDVAVPGVLEVGEVGRRLTFSEVEKSQVVFSTTGTVFMDRDAIAFPLRVRNWMPGDRMEPLGLKGRKKIKDIFTDRKVPRGRRGDIPLVVDQNSVLWVAEVALSQRVRLGSRTKRVLKIEII